MNLYKESWEKYKIPVIVITVIAALLGLAGGFVGVVLFAFFAFCLSYLLFVMVYYMKLSPEQRKNYNGHQTSTSTVAKETTTRSDQHTTTRPFYKKWWVWVIAIVLIVGLSSAMSSGSSSSSSSSSSNSQSSSQNSSSKKSSEDEKVDKAKVKNTCDALNQQISQKQELQGFKLSPSDDGGDQFTVTVPDSVVAMSKSEQKRIYTSMVRLIWNYDNGTNEGTFIQFQDQGGTPVGRSSYTGSYQAKVTD